MRRTSDHKNKTTVEWGSTNGVNSGFKKNRQLSTLTHDNKDFSNFRSTWSKRRRLVALRIRRLRADFVAELRVELESECSTFVETLYQLVR